MYPNNIMKLTETIKRVASWTFIILDPVSAPRRGSEQRIPLFVAIVLLLINISVIGLVFAAMVFWLVSMN